MNLHSLRLLALGAIVPLVSGQELLLDVNPTRLAGSPSLWNNSSAVANGVAFVAMNVGAYGTEPWVTDGTAAGTHLLADLGATAEGSVPYGFAPLNGGVVFYANTSRDLWWSDGTAANTIRLGPIETTLGPPIPVGGLAYYCAISPGFGAELWATDGTVAGTRFVADVRPGILGAEPTGFVDAGGIAYFQVRMPTGRRLARTDGTAAGTYEVGIGIPYGAVEGIAVVGTTVFFSVSYGPSVGELWTTDGTTAGTRLVRAGFAAAPRSMTAFGASILFTGTDAATGQEPWISDGTTAGTRLVRDILPGPTPPILPPSGYRVIGAQALFAADDGQHGLELWRTDGTTAGTALLVDVFPGSQSGYPLRSFALGGRMFFHANDGTHGEELWISDGTAAGTRLVADINPTGSSGVYPLVELNGDLLFGADDGRTGFEPWLTDGTAVGTRMIGDFASFPLSSDPIGFSRLGLRTLFAADDGTHGSEPWITDDTAFGTRLLSDLEPGPGGSSPRFVAEWKGRAWFVAFTQNHGTELWSTDGTAAGTTMLADIAAGNASSYPYTFLPLDDVALIVADDGVHGRELWVTDGTGAGTRMLDLDPALAADPQQLVRLGDLAYFVATDTAHGAELWRSDGTAAGTALVADIVPGPDRPTIRRLTAANGLLYFAGATLRGPLDVPIDLEPWVSDGSAAGTHRIVDLLPGLDSSSPSDFLEFAGQTWFVASRPDPSNPFGIINDLFVTDGTAAGTATRVGALGSVGALVVAGERIFFVRSGEVWSTDGTPAGTTITAEVWPGPTSSQPQNLVAAGTGTLVLFSARDSVHGREVFVSDGTSAGTRMLRDLWPGVLSSNPDFLARAGDSVYLAANDSASGVEPFRISLASIRGALAERLGRGCAGSNGTPRIRSIGIPRLGQPAFTIALERARVSAPTFLFLGLILQPGADVGQCVPSIAPPVISAALMSDAAGRAALTLAIPTSTSLLGGELFAEWLTLDPNGGLWQALAKSEILDVVIGG